MTKEEKVEDGLPVASAIPVLKVPSVLPLEFCELLVRRHQERDQKIQGFSGLSSPTLDESIKRAVHVNADTELGKAVDSIKQEIMGPIPVKNRVRS